MQRFEDHPVFASKEVSQLPLSPSELEEVRWLLAREVQHAPEPTSGAALKDRPTTDATADLCNLAERIYRARRERDRTFNDSIFAEPAWDILLDLFVRSQRGGRVSISSACQAAAVPPTTALRYVSTLVDKGYIARVSHPHDKRSTWLAMTTVGQDLMKSWLMLVRDRIL